YQPFNEGCTGLEQRWCITIAYQEIPTQPITPLRGQQKTCSCGASCSCGGRCGCSGSNGHATTQSNGCSVPASSSGTSTTAAACEPTRVLESFRLGVVPDPETCDTSETLFQGTLFFKLFDCISILLDLQSHFSTDTWQILTLAFNQKLSDSDTLNSDA